MDGSSATKRCTKCGRLWPASREFFASSRRSRDGLETWCKQCHADYHRAHRRPDVVAREEERDRLESEGLRRCRKCGDVKTADAEHFMPNARQRQGLSTECRACMNARLRRDKERRYLQKVPDPARTLQMRERRELAQRGQRRCSGCANVLPATAEYFNKDKRGFGGLSTRCRACERAERAAFMEQHPNYVQPGRARQREIYDRWRAQGCVVCGIDIPAVIDPHHLDPTQKDWNIGSKIGRVDDEDLLAELAKCVPICRTHHQLIEHEVRHGGDELSFDELVALIRKKYAIPPRRALGQQ
jgi:hypothetical protein